MHLIKFAEIVARLIALSALLAVSLSAIPDRAYAQWLGGTVAGMQSTGDGFPRLSCRALHYPTRTAMFTMNILIMPILATATQFMNMAIPVTVILGSGMATLKATRRALAMGMAVALETPTLGRTDTATLGRDVRMLTS